jgi:hypothetical protein
MLWKRTKKIWLLAILSMHFFIAVFLGLQLFGGLMFLVNLTAFGEYCFPGIFSRRIKTFLPARFRIIKINFLSKEYVSTIKETSPVIIREDYKIPDLFQK